MTNKIFGNDPQIIVWYTATHYLLYYSTVYIQMAGERGEKAADLFINSSNIHVRMLSCLVVLQTLTQGKHHPANEIHSLAFPTIS